MKNTLKIMAALATLLSSTTQAETFVTLYGILDAGVGYSKVDGTIVDPVTNQRVSLDRSRFGMTDSVKNGSRWGIRGKEDLGGGLYAKFQLESGFNLSNGQSTQGGRLFGRNATVGLASDNWGQFNLGRQYNIGSLYFYSVLGPMFGGGFTQLNMGTGSGFSSVNWVRYDQLVTYETPTINGFTMGLGYSFSADDSKSNQVGFNTADNTRAITAALRYGNGPLSAFISYDQLNPSNKLSDQQTQATPRSYVVGAAYDFEVAKLALAYSRTTDGWFGGAGLPGGAVGNFSGVPTNVFVDGFKSNSYLVAVSAPVGAAGSMFGSWARADANNKDLTGGDASSNTFSLGYTYTLSKRTDLYAVGSYTDNFAFLDDAKVKTVSVGLRHQF